MKSFLIKTLGCKVNQYESDGIATNLINHGWKTADSEEKADVCIINTCAVTSKACMQSRQAVRKLIKENSKARVIVTGCHAQIDPELIKSIDNVDAVVGHKDKYTIADKIVSWDFDFESIPVHENQSSLLVCDDTTFNVFNPVVKGDMTRAYLKIQDGCNAFCTYCIVPYARGKSRSMPEEQVINHLAELNMNGFKEAILTGIHTGLYGKDFEKKSSLDHLLRRIVDKKPIYRIRLSSIEPKEITDDLIHLAKSEKMICNHFHIPLQSGDDTILKLMKRPYNASFYSDIVMKIHQEIPGVCIGADVMVGFPGETEQAFDNTYQLISNMPVSYLHVFPYSARKGTKAYNFKNPVEPRTIQKRCARLRALANKKKKKFIETQMNQQLEGLIQQKNDIKTGKLIAITGNYISILLEDQPGMKGKIRKVIPEKWDENKNVVGRAIIEND